jgi:hypothetical protein
MVQVTHHGTSHEYYRGGHGDHGQPQITSFVMAPSVTRVAWNAFHCCALLTSLSSLRGSDVTEIYDGAFYATAVDALDLPPRLTMLRAWSFAKCHQLSNLAGLPYGTSVHRQAFGFDEDTFCALLLAKATALGFPSIDAWVQDRRLVPCRRYAVLTSVLVAQKQDTKRFISSPPVSTLLRNLARLPDEMVREIVEFAHGDFL